MFAAVIVNVVNLCIGCHVNELLAAYEGLSQILSVDSLIKG